jgi:hypothetical protein
MDRVLSLTTFDEERRRNSALEYWLSQPPEERIAEVERLRREYFQALQGPDYDGRPEGLCRTLLVLERTALSSRSSAGTPLDTTAGAFHR